MKITASTQCRFDGLPDTVASVEGDTLTVDGVSYDLSAIPEGGVATPEGEHPFIGTITRTNGEIVATILWLHGEGSIPNQPTDPSHYVLDIVSGPVPSPIIKVVSQ